MSQREPLSAGTDPEQTPRQGGGDPWQAFGYVVAGVAFYGFLGWLLDRWWGTSFLVAVGILVGAGLGIYMTLKRYGLLGTPLDEHQQRRTEERE